MALTTTTLSSALSINGRTLTVASGTGFTKGFRVLIDQEEMVVGATYTSGTSIPIVNRGSGGTAQVAHVVTANVIVGAASDFANPGPQATVTTQVAGRVRTLTSYTAAGAITLPVQGCDAVAVINSTAALAMTLAAPGKEIDGAILFIIANGKAAHTITVDGTGGFGNAGSNYDVATMTASGTTGLQCMACGGYWILLSPMTGTLTNCVPALA